MLEVNQRGNFNINESKQSTIIAITDIISHYTVKIGCVNKARDDERNTTWLAVTLHYETPLNDVLTLTKIS